MVSRLGQQQFSALPETASWTVGHRATPGLGAYGDSAWAYARPGAGYDPGRRVARVKGMLSPATVVGPL